MSLAPLINRLFPAISTTTSQDAWTPRTARTSSPGI